MRWFVKIITVFLSKSLFVGPTSRMEQKSKVPKQEMEGRRKSERGTVKGRWKWMNNH
jgi:hypothetical protein